MKTNFILAVAPNSISNKIDNLSSVEDGLLVTIPLAISIVAYGIKETIKLQLSRKNAEYAAEIERQKLDQQEKIDRIEYLEKQNQMLFQEIISFRRTLEMSGPLSLAMYEPSGIQKRKSGGLNRSRSGADARSQVLS